jgi:tRNA(fMet)-specific endonuclease VapC
VILLDTDIMTLWLIGHRTIAARVLGTADLVAATAVSRIELLRGRFEFLLKAGDGAQLQQAQSRLDQTERELARLVVVPINAAAASQFDRLRLLKALKKIGRADLLIASIAPAHRATLVTRNLRHFGHISGLILENWAE